MPSNKIGARKNGNFKAVSTAPSFNKTPVGASTPPLPYPTTQDLGNSVGVVPTVKFNGDPAYVLNQTTQPSCKGDNPGVAKGVKSGTVNGEVTPVKGSSTVRVGGKPIIRDGDPCTMNGGNNPGIYITTQAPSGAPAKSAAQTSSPPIQAETPAEKSFLEQAAKDYKDKVSPALHDFAGNAMDTGGTIAAAGGATAGVGGVMVATGVGAAPGAVAVVGGGATAAVGGGVSGVGAIVEGAATGLDAAANYVTGGQLNAMALATASAKRVVMSKIDKLTSWIPGKKKQGSAKQEVAPEKKTQPGSGGKDGFKVVDGKKPKDPCAHLKKGNTGETAKGEYRGGSYGGTQAPGIESHHMPANSVNGISSKSQGPSIQITPADHAETSSYGSSNEAKQYRSDVKDLIAQGKYRDAMAKEVKDVRRVAREAGDSKKYNKPIQEMLDYAKCRELLTKKK